MKRFFTSFLMLAAMLVSTTAWAASLTVGGVTVDLDATTTQTITGSGISGTVTYEPSSRTLYLKNATIQSGIRGRDLGASASERFFIYLTGWNSIVSNSHGMRFDNSYVVLYGAAGSTMSIDTSESSADFASIDAEGGTFQVWSIRLIMSGNSAGFYGSTSTGKLDFSNAMVSISCSGGAIQRCSRVTYDDCMCADTGVTHDPSVGYVNSSGTLVKSLTIWPYLTVGDEPVRTVSDSKDGSKYAWTWTKSTKTLEIKGDISTGTYYAIRNFAIDGLTIKCDGEYTVKSNWYGLCAQTNTTLSGSGKLVLNGTDASSGRGILVSGNKDLTVCMKELQAIGGANGIYTPGKLILNKLDDNSVYKFAGLTDGNFCVKELVMNDMDVWTGNTYWNSKDGYAYHNGEIAMTSNIENGTWFKPTSALEPYYVNAWVGGTRLRSDNKYVISPYITSGTATYDDSSKTLTLNNVTMDVTDDATECIYTGSAIGTLNVNLIGENNLTANSNAIGINSNATFTGTGKMMVTSKNRSAISGMGSCNNITIENSGYFIADGKQAGLYGNSNEVVLKKETSDPYGYRFTSTAGGDAIKNIKTLTLDNMDFYAQDGNPTYGTPGCYFDESAYAVKLNGGATASNVAFMSIKEKLPINIAGKQLNIVFNAENDIIEVGSKYITDGGGEAVCYDPSTKTLTLNGATIDYTYTGSDVAYYGCIKSDANELIVNVRGSNKLQSSNFYGMWNYKNGSKLTFTGDGSIDIKGTGIGLGPWASLCTIAIQDNVKLTATGARYGIGAENSGNDNGKLVVGGNAVVKASSIGQRAAITLEDGQAIVEPAGAEIKSQTYGYYICVGSETAQNVVIQKVEDYGLEVCDVTVTEANCADPFGDGKFKYDPSTLTLTINGASIDNTDIQNVVWNKGVDGLKIDVQGTNTFRVYDNIFKLSKTTTITGSGSVKGELSAEDGFGIYLNVSGTTCTIDGPTLDFKGQVAVGGSSSNLTINSGKLLFEPNGTAAAMALMIDNLTLGEGMYITEPDGAVFDEGYIKLDGEVYQGKVVIESAEVYDLAIGDKKVNSINCGDVLGDGVFKYDPSTKTLTINGNYTHTGGGTVIESYIDGLTINVASNSTIVTSASNTIIRLYANTTITGGKLTLMCTESSCNGIGIYLSVGTLTLKDATIDVTGDAVVYGITGQTTCSLVIENCDISASSHAHGAIYDWGDITLTNCYIAEPRPSQIIVLDDSKVGICDGDGTLVGSGTETGTVVIKAGADAIESIDNAAAAPTEVYDVAGRKLDQQRRGINIVRKADGKTTKVLRK